MPSSQSSIPTHSTQRMSWSRCTEATLTIVLTTNHQQKVTIRNYWHCSNCYPPCSISQLTSNESQIASIRFLVALNLLNSTQTCSFICKTKVSSTTYMEKLHGLNQRDLDRHSTDPQGPINIRSSCAKSQKSTDLIRNFVTAKSPNKSGSQSCC